MLLVTYFQRCACAALLATVVLGSLGHAADLPDYMQPIAGVVAVSPTEVANDNLLALNRSMFQLYDETGKLLQRNILAQHPVILGLFSGAGAASYYIGREWRPSKLPRSRSSISC
jgi:hypothetical protein